MNRRNFDDILGELCIHCPTYKYRDYDMQAYVDDKDFVLLVWDLCISKGYISNDFFCVTTWIVLQGEKYIKIWFVNDDKNVALKKTIELELL